MIMNIAVISTPNFGHINILKRFVNELKSDKFNFTFILASWTNYVITDEIIELEKISENIPIVIESSCTANNTGDTYCRVIELLPLFLEKCKNFNLIIYDLMCPEGYIVGKLLKIDTICVEPSYVGIFDNSSINYELELKNNIHHINKIENTYNIDLVNNILLISGNLALLSKRNIIFSWDKLITCGDFNKNTDEIKKICYFVRPTIPSINLPIKSEHKLIYFSIGTIAPGLIWDQLKKSSMETLHIFIKLIYDILISICEDRKDINMIVSSKRPVNEITDVKIPNNMYIYKTLNQIEVLRGADLFITHCGANSVNEAIDSETPVIGIPLMFDQHICAKAIEKLDIGYVFLHENYNESHDYPNSENIYFRYPFCINNFDQAKTILISSIDTILNKSYVNQFESIKNHQKLFFNNLLLKK